MYYERTESFNNYYPVKVPLESCLKHVVVPSEKAIFSKQINNVLFQKLLVINNIIRKRLKYLADIGEQCAM